jgi:hypothetical protein
MGNALDASSVIVGMVRAAGDEVNQTQERVRVVHVHARVTCRVWPVGPGRMMGPCGVIGPGGVWVVAHIGCHRGLATNAASGWQQRINPCSGVAYRNVSVSAE